MVFTATRARETNKGQTMTDPLGTNILNYTDYKLSLPEYGKHPP